MFTASFSARRDVARAWMLSTRIAPLPARLARLYRVAIVLVTACRWLIVSPITETYR